MCCSCSQITRTEVPNLLALFHSVFCISVLPCMALLSCGGCYTLPVGKSAAGWKLKRIGEYQINVKAKQITLGQHPDWLFPPLNSFSASVFHGAAIGFAACHRRLHCYPGTLLKNWRPCGCEVRWAFCLAYCPLSSGDFCRGDYLLGCFSHLQPLWIYLPSAFYTRTGAISFSICIPSASTNSQNLAWAASFVCT